MTVKEQLQRIVAQMGDEEAGATLTLVRGARAGATPVDLYGAAWGTILADVDPKALTVSGSPSITIPDGLPGLR